MVNALGAVQQAQRPIAAVSLPSTVSAGKRITLDASGSAAACGRSIAGFAWSVLSGSASLTGAGGSHVRLQAPGSGSVTLQVLVTDNLGATDTAQVVVTSAAASSSAPASAGNSPCLAPVTPLSPVTVTLSPTGPSVQAGGGTQTFQAALTGTGNTAVTWKVNGVTGGNATNGRISGAGLYTPPANLPANPVVTVTAVSVADPTASGFTGLTLTPPVAVSVTPASAMLLPGTGTQAFTATVSNSANGAVSWQVNGVPGGTATTGTISGAGLYTAPAQIPGSGIVTVSAVPVADPTRSGSASVTIAHAIVTVQPSSASLLSGASQLFIATVANTGNQNVSWLVNGILGGNDTVGTVSATGFYLAPAAVPSPAGVTVTALSAADPGASPGMAVVNLTAPAGSSSSSGSSSSGGGVNSGGSGADVSAGGISGTSGKGGGGAFDGWTLLVLAACLALRRRANRPAWRRCLRADGARSCGR
jgi:hypothetical protein